MKFESPHVGVAVSYPGVGGPRLNVNRFLSVRNPLRIPLMASDAGGTVTAAHRPSRIHLGG